MFVVVSTKHAKTREQQAKCVSSSHGWAYGSQGEQTNKQTQGATHKCDHRMEVLVASLYICVEWLLGCPGRETCQADSKPDRLLKPVKGRKRKTGEGTMISFIWGRHLVALHSRAGLQREPLFPHSHFCAPLLWAWAIQGLYGAAATCPGPHTPPLLPPPLF